jgi:hypothetical protein
LHGRPDVLSRLGIRSGIIPGIFDSNVAVVESKDSTDSSACGQRSDCSLILAARAFGGIHLAFGTLPLGSADSILELLALLPDPRLSGGRVAFAAPSKLIERRREQSSLFFLVADPEAPFLVSYLDKAMNRSLFAYSADWDELSSVLIVEHEMVHPVEHFLHETTQGASASFSLDVWAGLCHGMEPQIQPEELPAANHLRRASSLYPVAVNMLGMLQVSGLAHSVHAADDLDIMSTALCLSGLRSILRGRWRCAIDAATEAALRVTEVPRLRMPDWCSNDTGTRYTALPESALRGRAVLLRQGSFRPAALFSLPRPDRDHPAMMLWEKGSYNSYGDSKFWIMKPFMDFASRLSMLHGHDARPLFVDVGANLGTYSLFAALHGQNVLMFEPDPINVDHISQSVIVNGVSERCVISQATVMDRDGHKDKLCPLAGSYFASFVLGLQFGHAGHSRPIIFHPHVPFQEPSAPTRPTRGWTVASTLSASV